MTGLGTDLIQINLMSIELMLISDRERLITVLLITERERLIKKSLKTEADYNVAFKFELRLCLSQFDCV